MSQLTLMKVPASLKQINYVKSLRVARGLPIAGADELSKSEASKEIDALLKTPAQAPDAAPWKGAVPLSNYALEVDGVMKFYAVRQFKGTRYLRQLIGHPGQWQRVKPSYPVQALVMAKIAADPLRAAQAYGEHFTCCAVCNSPLSDPLSMERKIGPICWKRFGF